MSELQNTMIRLLSAPVMHMDPTRDNERNLTQHFIIEAVNAEKQLWRVIQLTGILHIDAQELYRKARCNYEELMLNNLELAEVQDIEYSLWKLHYKHIDEYRNRIRHSSLSKERLKLTAAQDVTTMQHEYENYLQGFKSFLSEATDFYRYLIRKIRRSYGIPEELWFVNEDGVSSSIDPVKMSRCQFLSHRCLVCLGDLARYSELYGNLNDESRSWSVAATHYLNASRIWPYSGNPHNQLAVLAIYVGDELLALYHCIRSLAVKEPFPDAWENLVLLFDKNRSTHLSSLSNEATFDFIKPYKSMVQTTALPSHKEATGDALTDQTELWSLIVRVISYFYVKPSLEDFPCIFGSSMRELEALLSMDDGKLKIAFESYQHMEVARTGPFRVLQVVSVLIFTIHALSETSKLQRAKHVEYMKQPSLIQKAFAATFIFMGRLVIRCMVSDSVDCSPILPAVLVFVEWLATMLDKVEEIYATDEKCASAMGYFFSAYVDLLNHFDDKRSEIASSDYNTLWEDDEFRGFSPISQFDGPLDLRVRQETRDAFEEKNESRVRICRIFVAAKKIVSSQKWIFYDEKTSKFCTSRLEEQLGQTEAVAVESDLVLQVQPHQEAAGACEIPESKDDEKQVSEHENLPVEDEEVILFNPTSIHNSAPLHLPPATRSNNKTLWHETIPEDSVVDSFSEPPDSPRFRALSADSDEVTNQVGPPSLSAWVVNQDNNWSSGEKGVKEGAEQASRTTVDTVSPCLSGLSIGGNEVSQQDINLTSSASGSQFPRGSTYMGDPVNAQRNVYSNIHPRAPDPFNAQRNVYSDIHHKANPYTPPMPSAPLLPDNAAWFTGNSSNYAENGALEHGNGFFPVGTQVSSYPIYRGTQDAPNFNPVDRYAPYTSQTSSHHWPQQYQVSIDPTHEHLLPVHFYTPTTLGRYQDYGVPRGPLYDQRINPTSFVPVNRMENPPYGFISGAGEQNSETIFPVYTEPGPYGATKDLRSEQLLLLKYLKEKEWYLQQEARLRGSV